MVFISTSHPADTVRYPVVVTSPLLGLSLDAIGHFKERSGGVPATVCDTTGNTVRQGYSYTCLAIGRGTSVGSLSRHICATPHVATNRLAQSFHDTSLKQARSSFALQSLQASRDLKSTWASKPQGMFAGDCLMLCSPTCHMRYGKPGFIVCINEVLCVFDHLLRAASNQS